MEKEKVWNKYNKDLRRFIQSKIKDNDACNDLMQEVYIRLHQNLNDLKDDTKIKPWLFSIARNVSMDHFRKQNSSKLVEIKDIPGEDPVKVNPFEKCLVPHINKLPYKYKEAFTKTELENYSQFDLANELKISYSGAKSRVQRARQLLRKYFKECCNITTDKYGNILSHSEDHNCTAC
jgi:RNA polymerase sigma-70 factor, ECF subfamily